MTTYKENIAEARRLILDKEYLNACELFADALEEMTKTLGEDSVEVAEVLFHYAEVLVKAVQENEDGADPISKGKQEEDEEKETGAPTLVESADAEDDDWEDCDEEEENEKDEEEDTEEQSNDIEIALESLERCALTYRTLIRDGKTEYRKQLASVLAFVADISLNNMGDPVIAAAEYENAAELRSLCSPPHDKTLAEYFVHAAVCYLMQYKVTEGTAHYRSAHKALSLRGEKLKAALDLVKSKPSSPQMDAKIAALQKQYDDIHSFVQDISIRLSEFDEAEVMALKQGSTLASEVGKVIASLKESQPDDPFAAAKAKAEAEPTMTLVPKSKTASEPSMNTLTVKPRAPKPSSEINTLVPRMKPAVAKTVVKKEGAKKIKKKKKIIKKKATST